MTAPWWWACSTCTELICEEDDSKALAKGMDAHRHGTTLASMNKVSPAIAAALRERERLERYLNYLPDNIRDQAFAALAPAAPKAEEAPSTQPLVPPTSAPPGSVRLPEKKPAPVPGGEKGCICAGNWREIIAEAEPLIDKTFIRPWDSRTFQFIGVLHSDDDFYYVMHGENGSLALLSCVGNIESHGYTEQRGGRSAGATPDGGERCPADHYGFDGEHLPCPHTRPSYHTCPHCLGLNQPAPPEGKEK